MKKLLLIALCATMLFTASACGQETVTYNPKNPYWLDKNDYGTSVAPVDETCVYDITYKPVENGNAEAVCELSGTYTTNVKNTELEGTACFLLTATTVVSGSYTAVKSGESVTFTDTTVNKVWFVWKDGFKFLRSEQTAQSTLPTNFNLIKDNNGNVFINYHYNTVVTYGEKDAQSAFTILNDDKAAMAKYFSLADGETATFKKYAKGNYVDSNALYFFVRSFDFAEGLNYSFSSIDVLNKAKHTMRLSYESSSTISPKANGISLHGSLSDEETAEVYTINVAINEKYSGNAISCTYFSATKKWRHALCKMETTLPYNLGKLVYNLKEFSY